MVAVEAARLADTGLPSAALSGGWRISIKAQYLDARKGSDVTAATQDWLLRLASACCFSVYFLLCGEIWPNHDVQRWRLRPTNTDVAHGCWPWQFLQLLSVNVTRSSTKSFRFSWLKVKTTPLTCPGVLSSLHWIYVHLLCWRVSCSPVSSRTFQKPFPNSSNSRVFKSFKRLSTTVKIKSSKNTHQQSYMRINEWAPN